MVEIIIVIATIIWVTSQLCKESKLKPAPEGTDVIRVNSDRCSGKYTYKEMNQRRNW